MSAIQERFPFDKEFQRKLLGLLVQDLSFLSNSADLIRPEYFEDRSMSWAYGAIRAFYYKYGRPPEEYELKNELNKGLAKKEVSEGDKEAYEGTVAKAFYKVVDTTYLREEVVRFCRNQELFKEVLQAAAAIKDAATEDDIIAAIPGRMQKALDVGNYLEDDGSFYFRDLDARLFYRATKQVEDVFPTGIPQLDAYLGGGLKRGQLGVVVGGTGSGKCLRVGTEVLMHDGSLKKVEDVGVGDLLMGPDSTPRKVLSTITGREELFRVTPVKGESFVCTGDHILTLMHTTKGTLVDIRLDEYLVKSKKFKHLHKVVRAGLVEFPEQEALPLDPYFLGVWFGDGSKEWIGTGHRSSGGAGRWDNLLLDLLRAIVGPEAKIPHQYLTASKEDRLQLLAGFIDTDGTLSSCGAGYYITQKREDYARSIAFLCRSLGFSAYINPKVVGGVTYHRVSIFGDCDQIPVRLSRKKAHPRQQTKSVLRTGIKSVCSVGEDYFAGFMLDGDQRFLLGDFTITHNSIALPYIGKRNLLDRRKVCHISLELKAMEVAERYDSLISRVPIHNLETMEEEVRQGVEWYGERFGDAMNIKFFPAKTVGTAGIKGYLESLRTKGFATDVALVDYEDLLRPSVRRDRADIELGDISAELKGIAGELDIGIWTATQLNRSGYGKEEPSLDELAGSFMKAFEPDVMILIGRTPAEAKKGIINIHIGKNRNGPDKITIQITSAYERMSFIDLGKTQYGLAEEHAVIDPNATGNGPSSGGGGKEIDKIIKALAEQEAKKKSGNK